MKTLKLEIKISDKIHKEFKNYCKTNGILTSRGYIELLEKALNKKTVEDKFLETFDFLNEENVSEMVDVIFVSNELAEIVKSKFEAVNKK
jgi:hypothetical protein